jgi:hypothetical protein
MAMRRKEAAAMLPKPRPDAFAVGLRNVQIIQRGAREELKPPFLHRRRELFQLWLQFKQEHQPVRLALETVFADHSGQVKIRAPKLQPEFLVRLARGASVGGFAVICVQFATARTPETAIRLLRAFEQEDFILRVEAVEQRGDFIRQLHPRSVAIAPAGSSVLSGLRVAMGRNAH